MRAPTRERRAVAVRGIVQGVGFRPFVYTLARSHGLVGWVRNDSDGVYLEIEGEPAGIEQFLRCLQEKPPPLAVIEAVRSRAIRPCGEREFRIEASSEASDHRALISPDVATCDACLRELFDPADRRYRYPFINCTQCGPRFTITRGIPYDRPLTTMAGFPMCERCRAEYEDPADRRFHAQPNACPDCGPQVRLLAPSGADLPGDDAITAAAELLKQGAVLAVKGLGGYHLACDPFSKEAVTALRSRKVRQDKPFALMALDLTQARELCHVSDEEAVLLESPARPIVLLERRADAGVQADLAPRQSTLGVMLAYTPLHHLLLHDGGIPLVMTSGNRSDEPIAYRDDEAFEQLGGIADAFLVHNRPIHMRCDDSVARGSQLIRRSRGYAPRPLTVAEPFRRPVLACGAELKATFCLGRERHAFLSHHIGDLENYETYRSYREAVEHYRRLFEVHPEVIVCDLHPEYLSTKYAEELAEAGLPLVRVQHHPAHIASCLADNQRPSDERVIGVALDGTGYGLDGAIWGGEVFSGSIREGFVRRAHLQYVPLPGGAAAIRHPWRMAVAHLLSAFGEEEVRNLPLMGVDQTREAELRLIARMCSRRINSPLTSSAGRLFDAVAALLSLPGTDRVTYEGQAAVELELAAERTAGEAAYPVNLDRSGVLETDDLIRGVVADLRAGGDRREIAARFHASLAEGVAGCCRWLRDVDGFERVALSGGVFQNVRLLNELVTRLQADRFTVYVHRQVPANDGGLALGQAVLAEWMT